jgi:transmembrane sensor
MNGTDAASRGRVAAEAAEWLATMQSLDVTVRQRVQFAEWLASSAEHVHEYLQSSAIWRDLGVTRVSARDLEDLVAAARRDAASGNVVVFEGLSAPSERSPPARRYRRWQVGLAAAVLLVAVASLSWKAAAPGWRGQEYQTGVGEQTSFTLADGSVVRLNTRSRLRTRMTAQERNMELLEGEALFEVAADSQRPFRVTLGTTTVQALGTVFNVYRKAGEATVTVIEGRVQVASPATARPQVLGIKEQAKVSEGGSITRAQSVDLQQVTAWKDRRLVFAGSSLQSATAEFNRYNARQLRVEGEELGRIRINAVFSATDPGSLVDFLQRTEGVSVRHDEDGTEVLHRR